MKAEAESGAEHFERWLARLNLDALRNHRVAEAEAGDREFDRDKRIGTCVGAERAIVGPVDLAPVGEDVGDQRRADHRAEKIVHHHPVIMPSDGAAAFVEQSASG